MTNILIFTYLRPNLSKFSHDRLFLMNFIDFYKPLDVIVV